MLLCYSYGIIYGRYIKIQGRYHDITKAIVSINVSSPLQKGITCEKTKKKKKRTNARDFVHHWTLALILCMLSVNHPVKITFL